MLYLYLLAVIGAVTVGALMWRAFGPEKRPRSYAAGPVAPDDDPEFLRRLAENQRKQKRPDTEE